MELKEACRNIVNSRYVNRGTDLSHDLENAEVISEYIANYIDDNPHATVDEVFSDDRMYEILAQIKAENKMYLRIDKAKTYVKLNHICDMVEILFARKVDRFKARYWTNRTVMCDDCNTPAEFIDSADVYFGRSYGMIWCCPCCGNYVGVHPGTNIPLGNMVDKETKRFRMEVHRELDKKFKDKNAAYRWLSKSMHLSSSKAHVGKLSKEQCIKVLGLLSQQ